MIETGIIRSQTGTATIIHTFTATATGSHYAGYLIVHEFHMQHNKQICALNSVILYKRKTANSRKPALLTLLALLMHGIKHLKHTNHKHEVTGLQHVIHCTKLHMIHVRDGHQAFVAGTRGGMGSVSSLISGAKTAPDLDSSAKPLIFDKSTSEPAVKTLVSSFAHSLSHQH